MGFMLNVFARAGDWLGDWFQAHSTIDVTATEMDFCAIEFIGGPYDGLVQKVPSCDSWQLPVIIEMLVSRQRLDANVSRYTSATDQATSVASYRQTGDGPHWRYCYDSSLPPANDAT